MRGRVVSAFAVLALLGAGQQVAVAESTDGQFIVSRNSAGIRDSASLSTPVVARGLVHDSKGAPSAGADVVLLAWPSNDVTQRLAVGDEVVLQPVAVAVSAADGSYALRLESTDLVKPLSGSDGIVNFDVVASKGAASSGVSSGLFSFARKLNEAEAGSALIDVGASDGDLASAEPAEVTLRYGDAPRETNVEPGLPTDDSATVIATSAAPLQKDGDIVCKVKLAQDHGPKWTLVGQTYNAASYVESEYTYIKTASSSLGVGVSATGKAGTFKASGTTTRTTTVTQEYGKAGHHAKRYFDTMFRYGTFRHDCYDSGSGYQWTTYSARNTGYVGGTRIRKLDFYPGATHCVPQAAGTKFIKDETRAQTWTDGVEFPGMGMDFSTTTGYTSTAKISYRIGPFNRSVCGLHGDPGGAARVVVARW